MISARGDEPTFHNTVEASAYFGVNQTTLIRRLRGGMLNLNFKRRNKLPQELIDKIHEAKDRMSVYEAARYAGVDRKTIRKYWEMLH